MILYLMRHGIAAGLGAGSDSERPLTHKGEQRTRQAARGLMHLGVKLESIWSSPLLRARQTAALAAEALNPTSAKIVITSALEPDQLPAVLFSELDRARLSRVLCVGHLPHLDLILGEALTGTRTSLGSFKKAGAAAIDFPVSPVSVGRLLWFMPPRVLRSIAQAADADDDD